MRKKVILAAMAMAIGVACNANDLTTFKNTSDEPEKHIVTDTVISHHNHEALEDEGYPCPCSESYCRECGKQLEYSAKAYKKFKKNTKCYKCRGKGCNDCDSTGLDWDWVPGCKCNKCKIGYVQPNDC